MHQNLLRMLSIETYAAAWKQIARFSFHLVFFALRIPMTARQDLDCVYNAVRRNLPLSCRILRFVEGNQLSIMQGDSRLEW
jgi:hypothetical protein